MAEPLQPGVGLAQTFLQPEREVQVPPPVAGGPFRQPATSVVQTGAGGRRPRCRPGYWHTIAHATSTALTISVAELPQGQPGQNLVAAGPHGRAARRRGSQWHTASTETHTAYLDVVLSSAKDRGYRLGVPRFRNNEVSGNWFASLVQYVYPPLRQLAGVFVQGGRGRRGRVRGSSGQVVGDQTNTQLLSTAELIQGQPAQTLVSSARGGRAQRRRMGQWHAASIETKTVFEDPGTRISYRETVLADGPIGYWRLDDSDAMVRDQSPTGNPGTFNGGVTKGLAGALVEPDAAMSFDGSSGYIELGNLAAYQLSTASLEAWVQTTSTDTLTKAVFVKSSAFGLFMDGLKFRVYDWTANTFRDSGVSINDGNWHHLLVTVQSGVANGTKLYVDGVLQLTTLLTVASQANSFQIAANTAIQFWPGSIDEVAFYDHVLSYDRIVQHYQVARAAPAQRLARAQERSWRARISSFRNNDSPASDFLADLMGGLAQPLRQLAGVVVGVGAAGRRARSRIGFSGRWGDQVSTQLLSSAETLQSQPAQASVAAGRGGRAQRRRAGQWHRGSTETATVYQDAVIGSTKDRVWRAAVPRFRNWDLPAANFLANVFVVLQPLRQLASHIVVAGQAGRRALRRTGFSGRWGDQVNTQLSAASEVVQSQPAQSFVSGARGNRAQRRRAGQWHYASGETQTVYRDQASARAEDRQWRQRVALFRNFEQGGARLAGWLNQPSRKLAEVMIQAGAASRRATRRVGFWHTAADQVSTTLASTSELPPRMLADAYAMSGRVRSRRRAGLAHLASQETHTAYLERVISRTAPESKRVQPVPRLRHWWQTAANWLLNILIGLPPGTLLRFYVQDQEPAKSLASNRQQGALLDAEPRTGLTSAEPTSAPTDTEPPSGVNTRVKGQ